MDCGSNIGMSILYFKCLYPGSTIMAFEPDPEAFGLLQENVKRNKLANVTVLNFALDFTAGKAILFGSEKPGSLNKSLIRSSDRPIGTTIDSKRLSEFIDHPIDLLKIDVEGAEEKIIEDLIFHKKLSAIKNLIIEFHPRYADSSLDDFSAKLKTHHFSCQIVKDMLHPGATEYMIYGSSEIF
jgi:FkbM family methyltransferase